MGPNGRYKCSSPKIIAPAGVAPETCSQCHCRDHPPIPGEKPKKRVVTRSARTAAGQPYVRVAKCNRTKQYNWAAFHGDGRVIETGTESTQEKARQEAQLAVAPFIPVGVVAKPPLIKSRPEQSTRYRLDVRPIIELDRGGIGDSLLVAAVATGAGGTVRVPEHRRQWVELFAGCAGGERRIRLDAYGATDRSVPRWQWWANQLGVPAVLPEPKPLPAHAVEWAVPLAGRIVIAPFAAHANRTWPLERWIDVARALEAIGFDLIILDDGRRERTDGFQFGRTVRLLKEQPARVAAVIKTAAAFAGNDSGMAHVAGFLRTPAIALCSSASDTNIFGLYPTVRTLGSRADGFDQITPDNVLNSVLDRVGSTLGDFPTSEFLRVIAQADQWRELSWLPIYAPLWRTVRALAPRRILEIGTRAGYSAWTMLHACPDATLLGLDLDSDRDGGYVGACEHARRINPDRFELRIADSHELTEFPPADLVYVDGDHTESGCRQDLDLAKDSGAHWLIVDDVANCPEVRTACDRFAADHGLNPRWVPSRTGLYVFDMSEARRPSRTLAAADVLILSGSTAGYDPDSIVAANHARFATITGHRQKFRTDGFDPTRPPAWSKIRFLLEATRQPPRPPWVFWFDADALFLRPGDLREFCDPAYDLVIGVDVNGLNTGAFFVRNCGWARAFLERVWALGDREEFRTHAWWEQAAVQHLYLTDVDVRPHVKLVSHRLFNSYPHWANHGYAEGELVAHFCGLDRAKKAACLKDWASLLTAKE